MVGDMIPKKMQITIKKDWFNKRGLQTKEVFLLTRITKVTNLFNNHPIMLVLIAEMISCVLLAIEDLLILKSMPRTNAKLATKRRRSTKKTQRTTMQLTKWFIRRDHRDSSNLTRYILLKLVTTIVDFLPNWLMDNTDSTREQWKEDITLRKPWGQWTKMKFTRILHSEINYRNFILNS